MESGGVINKINLQKVLKYMFSILLLCSNLLFTETSNSNKTWYGDPDLQGIWTNATLTTLERPRHFKTLEVNEEEARSVPLYQNQLRTSKGSLRDIQTNKQGHQQQGEHELKAHLEAKNNTQSQQATAKHSRHQQKRERQRKQNKTQRNAAAHIKANKETNTHNEQLINRQRKQQKHNAT